MIHLYLITGEIREMIEHYSRQVNQRQLARNAMTKWQGGRSENDICKRETPKIIKLSGG